MSAREILSEVEKLPIELMPEVMAIIRRRMAEERRAATPIGGGIRPGFEEMANRVFTNYRELFHKLAQ